MSRALPWALSGSISPTPQAPAPDGVASGILPFAPVSKLHGRRHEWRRKYDLVAFNRSEPGATAGTVWVYLTNAAGTGVGWGGVWHPSFCGGTEICTVANIDGVGGEHLVAFNRNTSAAPNNGDVYVFTRVPLAPAQPTGDMSFSA